MNFLESVKLKLKKVIDDKKYINLVVYALLSLLVLYGLLITVKYVKENFKAVVFVAVVLWCLISSYIDKKHKKKELVHNMKNEVDQKQAIIEQEETEVTYAILQKELYVVFGELNEVLKIKRPQSLSEIVIPNSIFQRNNINYYQFCCLQSDNEVLDNVTFKDLLQQRITQRLMAFEVYGLKQSFYVYEGRTYPLIKVIEVENIGINIYITVTIVNEMFCKEEWLKALVKKEQYHRHIDTGDRDF